MSAHNCRVGKITPNFEKEIDSDNNLESSLEVECLNNNLEEDFNN